MAYDSPNAQVRREHCCPPTTAGATTKGSKFAQFQAFRLKRAHAIAKTAGTHAGHGYDIYVGTTSVATIALGTSGTNVAASSGTINATVTSLQEVSANSLVDATGVAQIIYEYEMLHDGTMTG